MGRASWRKTTRCEEQPQEGKTSVILNQNYDQIQKGGGGGGGGRGSSSSSVSSNTELKKARMNEEEETNSLRDLIQNLTANMESNFAKLHEELCGLRQEMKEEIDMLKSKKGVDEIWATIEDMKEQPKL